MIDNPIKVEIFDAQDEIIAPVTREISVTYNLDAFSFGYLAVQLETTDPLGLDLYRRFLSGELLQYRVTGRFGMYTGDITSVYKYGEAGTGEVSLYGRCHKELLFQVLGFPDPSRDVPQDQRQTHKAYVGSELTVMRQVLADNLRDRLGVPIRFPSGSMGAQIEVDFRFDQIYRHLYEDSEDRGGVLLKENGELVFEIHRDFDNHEYVLSAREQVHHEQPITVDGGLVSRYQGTVDRGEAKRVIVGGPGEMLDRLVVDIPYPEDEWEAGAGAQTRTHSDILRDYERTMDGRIEKAREDNEGQAAVLALEKEKEEGLATRRSTYRAAVGSASANRPTPPAPRRRFPAEVFYEDTSPEVDKRRYPSDDNPALEDLIEAMRASGAKKLEEASEQAGMQFVITETDQFYLGEGGAFQIGDWVRIGVDGVDLGEIRLEKAVASYTREEGYVLKISDTEIDDTTERKQVDRIIKVLRELVTASRRR